MKKHIVIGILAHVDAGKTTLSEAILYHTGKCKNLGRVDAGTTVMDYDGMEKCRGITIYSKQAQFELADTEVTLLDTPGHVDFSAEMERTLQVLDYAVLVVSASTPIQSHTRRLWKLLEQYGIPVFVFVNKMDQPDNDTDTVMKTLKKELSDGCVCFTCYEKETVFAASDCMEEVCMASGSEELLERYMNEGTVALANLRSLVSERRLFPCFFGSALKLCGVQELLEGINQYTVGYQADREEFGARVYKITRDKNGSRLAHVKITSGRLSVREQIGEEKVTQIRIYQGESYETVPQIGAGYICALAGLDSVVAGQGLGCFEANNMELIEPVLTYELSFATDVSKRKMYPLLQELCEEFPELHITWLEETETIEIMLMGQVQTEVLTEVIKARFSVTPVFSTGKITYRETVRDTVIGVGHFEPLRHYAEAHIRIEPLPAGSGIEVGAEVSEDVLDKNWQRLIMTHLREHTHVGVRLGARLTDVRLTVINGRAHTKHTEGGDFRQATYRAVRQGLMEADTVILEPFYNFILEIPSNQIGRAMTDLEQRFCVLEPMELSEDKALLKGYGPVATLRDYQIHVNAYTSGNGSISVSFRGYFPCHNEEEVLAESSYDPEADLKNPTSSVFCAHGSGYLVPWDEVKQNMHVFDEEEREYRQEEVVKRSRESFDYSIDLEEIDRIFSKTFSSNKKEEKQGFKKKKPLSVTYGSQKKSAKPAEKKKRIVLIDGYNVIFSWELLTALAKENLDAAKDKLISLLSNYQSICEEEFLLVFDGYKVKGNHGSDLVVEDVHVLYTKEGETADSYIERYAHSMGKEQQITVVTSDGLIQTLARGAGCRVCSSREFYLRMAEDFQELREAYRIE